MTSERAQIRDPRVRKLADEISEAQRREIAEMRYLVAKASEGEPIEGIFEDPPTEPGTIQDALSNTLISQLDLAPVASAETEPLLAAAARCSFNRSRDSDPILWIDDEGHTAAVKLNGVFVALAAASEQQEGVQAFASPGITIIVRQLGEDAEDWRQGAELVFGLDQGVSVGYRGFYACNAG